MRQLTQVRIGERAPRWASLGSLDGRWPALWRGYIWVQSETTPSATWCRTAPDAKQALAGWPVPYGVIWGATLEATSHVATPTRYFRRTITRGAMVRKKASRLQVERLRSFWWQTFRVPSVHHAGVGSEAHLVPASRVADQLRALRAHVALATLARTPRRHISTAVISGFVWSLV